MGKPVYAYCGILAPVVAFVFTFVSISLTPAFDWRTSYLSDLAGFGGETPLWWAHGLPSLLFNTGLVLTGALVMVFLLGFRKEMVKLVGVLPLAIFFIVAAAFSGIGVLPETVGMPHNYVSYVFFLLVPVAAIAMGLAWVKTNRSEGLGSIALGVVSLLLVPLINEGSFSPAILELVPVLVITVLLEFFAVKMVRQ